MSKDEKLNKTLMNFYGIEHKADRFWERIHGNYMVFAQIDTLPPSLKVYDDTYKEIQVDRVYYIDDKSKTKLLIYKKNMT